MRRLIRTGLVAMGALALAQHAGAQALGPQRQFLAIEPYYERGTFDVGENISKRNTNGYGARLWINLDPFHFIPNGSIALYGSYSPRQSDAGTGDLSTRTFGAEYDQYLVRRPLGGIIDPFLTVGYSRVKLKGYSTTGTLVSSRWFNGVPVGGGVRIPFPNRFELRGDVKDLILFNTRTGTAGASRTTNNLLLQAALGITF